MVRHCHYWCMVVPGRAGGGEEMGGLRGVKHYLQRTALQGSPTTITAITNVYQPNAKGKDPGKHPFKKYFEELADRRPDHY